MVIWEMSAKVPKSTVRKGAGFRLLTAGTQEWWRMSTIEGLATIFGADDVGWIHDGVMGEERLHERGNWYIRQLFDPYPDLKLKPNFRALEIGSGLGYIRQAIARYGSSHGVPADCIVGLDIAAPMLEKAKARLGSGPPFEFLNYDGVHVPLEDGSLDFIYSVATLQHIPRNTSSTCSLRSSDCYPRPDSAFFM
jgi:SAM-dependent methyltransferase